MGLSAWLARAVGAHLRERARWEEGRRAAEELVIESEALHGPSTPEDLAWVEQAMATLFPDGYRSTDLGRAG